MPCIVISCHYLPVSGLGNLRACCLPWKWWPFLSLSRIEPQFSVTRHCYGGPIPYHRKLTGQKLERLVAKGDQYFIINHQEHNRSWKVWNLINTTLHKSGLYACISSKMTKNIHNAIKHTTTVSMSHSQCHHVKVDAEKCMA